MNKEPYKPSKLNKLVNPYFVIKRVKPIIKLMGIILKKNRYTSFFSRLLLFLFQHSNKTNDCIITESDNPNATPCAPIVCMNKKIKGRVAMTAIVVNTAGKIVF